MKALSCREQTETAPALRLGPADSFSLWNDLCRRLAARGVQMPDTPTETTLIREALAEVEAECIRFIEATLAAKQPSTRPPIWIDPALNTAETMAAGQLIVSFDPSLQTPRRAERAARSPSQPKDIAMHDWTIENDEGKRWRIVGPDARWTMQPVGNIDVREAEEVCTLAVEGHRAGTEWFWRIVDANGIANLSSDERQAVRELVVMAARFDLVKHLERQRGFSRRTFGPGPRTKGVLDHIRKELAEIEADPSDLGEWIDLILLAFDGAWRAGFTPEEIAQGLDAKQTRNEARDWPDWRTADPDKAIEHVRTSEGDRFIGLTLGEIAEQQAPEA